MICLHTPARFGAIGLFYADFSPVEEIEVKRILIDRLGRHTVRLNATVRACRSLLTVSSPASNGSSGGATRQAARRTTRDQTPRGVAGRPRLDPGCGRG